MQETKTLFVATMALCEAAAYYKTQGKTLWDAMIDMYEKYGYYKDDIKSITLKGHRGPGEDPVYSGNSAEQPACTVGDYKVTSARDYKKGHHQESGDRRSDRYRTSVLQRSVL